MNDEAKGRAVAFFGILLLIAIVINVTQRRPREPYIPPPSPAQQIQQAPVDPPKPQTPPAPVVTKPVIWPGDVPPTQIIKIPDLINPTSGVMDISIKPGDEIQFEIAPPWQTDTKELPSALEIAVNEGEGFMLLSDYQAKLKRLRDSGKTLLATNLFTVRYHLRAGAREPADLRMTVSKRSVEEDRPVPPVPPEQFGSLSVIYDGIQGRGRYVTIDLILKNSNASTAIGVALHCDPSTFVPNNEHIRSAVRASDGTEYTCENDGILGILWLNARPSRLTEIGPGESRKISIKYSSN